MLEQLPKWTEDRQKSVWSYAMSVSENKGTYDFFLKNIYIKYTQKVK